MTTQNKIRILSTLTTRDEGGRHFTRLVSQSDLDTLEADGLIAINRPIHASGIPYAEEHYSVEVTADGVELVEAAS